MQIDFIAEIGWNFMGDMDLAESMISAAKEANATIAKFQYWNPEKLREGPWDSDGRREIYNKAKLNKEKIDQLASICREKEVDFLVSAFNKDDALFLKEFSEDAIKIPSHEVANTELISFSLENFEKVYLSLGACSHEELLDCSKIVKQIRPNDNNVVLMHCVSSYPCEIDRINLKRIDYLGEIFNGRLGLSDHTSSTLVPALSVIKGVEVIEKHFTVDHSLPGRDNKFAMLPEDFKEMVNLANQASQTIIDRGINAQESEMDTIKNYRGRWG